MLSTQIFVNQNSFDKGFSYDNLELPRLSFISIFPDSQIQWSTLRYVDKDLLC